MAILRDSDGNYIYPSTTIFVEPMSKKVWKCNKCNWIIKIGSNVREGDCPPDHTPANHYGCGGVFELVNIEDAL